MIPVKHEGQVIDNLPGIEPDVEAKLSAAAGHLIMKSLSDLYSNSTLAVVREYSTNAMDSHIEAGISDPIDVTLPNELHPYFIVTDHGVGLDKESIKDLYMTFGDSTKRTSNEYNGLLGYGCKSALAYTNSFTVTSVRGGMKTVALITRREDEVMVCKVVVHSPTDERNGVSIQVPVSNVDEFNRIALRFYKFWPKGKVLINGSLLENPFTTQENRLRPGLYKNPLDKNSYIVMGNVAYPINAPETLFPSTGAYVPFVAYVDNGAVEFTPSREALKYTDRTTTKLQAVVDDYIAERKAEAEKEVKHAKTPWEALIASRKWWNLLHIRIPYKGKEIPGEIEFNGRLWHTGWRRYPVETLNKYHGNNQIDLNSPFLIVTGATSTVGSYHRGRLKEWSKTDHNPFGGRLPALVYFTEDDAWNSEWVNPSHVISWETVKAQTPSQRVSGGGAQRIKGSWDLLTPDGSRRYGVPLTKAKFWIPLDEAKRRLRRGDWQKIANEFDLLHDVVIVPANRVSTFHRNFPKAEYIMQWLESKVDLNGVAMYNGEQREYFSISMSDRKYLSMYDEKRVDDPELKKLIKLSKRTDIQKPADYDKNASRASMLNLNFKALLAKHDYLEKFNARHPLLPYGIQSISFGAVARNQDHIYYYINAVYAARKAENV